MLIWLLKLTLTPILVALASLAARRWGPRVGGILIGFPVMTGPIMLFLAWEQGLAFTERAIVGVQLALAAVCVWVLVYAVAARRLTWLPSLLIASLTYGPVSLALVALEADLTMASGLAFAAILLTLGLIGRPTPPRVRGPLPWWDLWLRMAVAALLIALITGLAERMGPLMSGIVGTYPVISTVVVSFTHHQWGPEAAIAILRGLLLSLIAFTTCFLVIGSLLVERGLLVSYTLGLTACALTSLAVITIDALLARRRSPAAG